MNKKALLAGVAVAAMAVVLAPADRAHALVFDLDTCFTGNCSSIVGFPANHPTMEITQVAGMSNMVNVTFNANTMPAGQFITQWWINLNPSFFDASGLINTLTVDYVSGQNVVNLEVISGNNNVPPETFPVGYDANEVQPGGGGDFDFLFEWEQSNSNNRFTNGESATFKLTTGSGTLSPSDFNVLSAPQGNQPLFYTAAHIQGLAGDGSAKVGANDPGNGNGGPGPMPEPMSMALLGLGLAGLGWLTRRRA